MADAESQQVVKSCVSGVAATPVTNCMSQTQALVSETPPHNGWESQRLSPTPYLATLKTRTQSGGGRHFIKIVDEDYSTTVLTLFVHEGCSAESRLPLGIHI